LEWQPTKSYQLKAGKFAGWEDGTWLESSLLIFVKGYEELTSMNYWNDQEWHSNLSGDRVRLPNLRDY
jgi:hypothetical protein